MLRATLALMLALPLSAAPLQILAIGDSLTEEYYFEFPFSAPASSQFLGEANIFNWPELLGSHRSDEATLGLPYKNQFAGFSDLRDGGYSRNFSVPGFTTANWLELINTVNLPTNIFDDDYLLQLANWRTREALIDELPIADVVVILLGGNDLKQNYFRIFAGTESPGFFNGLVENLRTIHTFVFTRNPNVPIIVCTFPDVGATPQIYNSYTDTAMAASARAKIAQLNQDIIAMVAEENAKPGHNVDTKIARIDSLTDRAFDQSPFHLNGTVFTLEGHPDNPPDRVFARDNFHPSTVAQALMANEIMAAINEAAGTSLTPFSEREILEDILGLAPDQPYLDWIDAYSVEDSSMNGDPDHDLLPNLVEMGLGTRPDQPSSPINGTWQPGSGLTWTPDPVAARYLDLFAEESADLSVWAPVPESRLSHGVDTTTASPPIGPESHFGRLNALPR